MDETAQISAERQMRRRLLDYCRGVDRCDAELIASAYHPDATDDHGPFQGSGEELATFVSAALLEHYDATMHAIGDSIFDFADDRTAYVETYVHADHRGHDEEGDYLERFGARYLDRFEERGGEWKIADRVVVVEWADVSRLSPLRGSGRYVSGRRDRDDLAYRRTPRDPNEALPRLGDRSS